MENKKRFKLKDLENNDTIGYFDTRKELNKAWDEYNDDCEGAWMPEIRELNPETGKYKRIV
jgi:hypothetical protein